MFRSDAPIVYRPGSPWCLRWLVSWWPGLWCWMVGPPGDMGWCGVGCASCFVGGLLCPSAPCGHARVWHLGSLPRWCRWSRLPSFPTICSVSRASPGVLLGWCLLGVPPLGHFRWFQKGCGFALPRFFTSGFCAFVARCWGTLMGRIHAVRGPGVSVLAVHDSLAGSGLIWGVVVWCVLPSCCWGSSLPLLSVALVLLRQHPGAWLVSLVLLHQRLGAHLASLVLLHQHLGAWLACLVLESASWFVLLCPRLC